MPRENLEDTIRRVFTEEADKRSQKDKEEKDPWAKLEGTVRRIFNEEFDKRLNDGQASGGEGGDDDKGGDGGILDFLVKRG